MPVQILDKRHNGGSELDALAVQRLCQRLLARCGLEHNSLSLVLLDDEQMAECNTQYRGKKGPTNVLSFPAQFPPEAPPEMRNDLGDVLISVDTALREAAQQEKLLMTRLGELALHGILHLAGYDHERSEAEAVVMWDKEQRIFSQLDTRRQRMPGIPELSVNVDHVATLRQARGGLEPDPVLAAGLCELAGASGIVAHLREDRRHMQDRDLRLLRETVKTALNLEMAATKELVAFALDLQPDMVTLVPEKRQELTTEGGLDVAGLQKKLAPSVRKLREAGLAVSLFVDAESEQIQAAAKLGASHVELHTGRYSDAATPAEQEREFVNLCRASELAQEQNLLVKAGHGLNYRNCARIAAIPGMTDLSIGHAIIGRAVLVGLERAVREMLAIMREAASLPQGSQAERA